jgi:hypothetical protein
MAITLTIAGADKTALLRTNTIIISDNLNSRNLFSCSLVDLAGSYRPVIGNSVVLTKDATTLFSGTIDRIAESLFDNKSALQYDLTCVDYNQLFDRFLVPEVYESELAGDIVKDIIDQFVSTESITYTAVEDGPTITKVVFNYTTATAALNELSELVGYDWYLDYDKDLHFFERSSNAAPFSLTGNSGNYRNARIEHNRDEYRNIQYVRAGQDITDARTESFKGDSANRVFTLKYPVALVPSSITVNSVSKTIGIQGVESGKDWYWNKNQKQINQDDAGTVLTSSDTLEVTYQGFFPIIAQALKDTEISTRASVEGGSGVYESLNDSPNIDISDYAEEKAQGLLRRYGKIPEIVYFETDVDGLRAGQLMSITIPEHGISGTYLIENVDFNDLYSDTLRYQVKALSGENIGGWINFFKRMIQQGQKYVIRENEVLIRLRQFSDDLTAQETFSASDNSPENRVGYLVVGFGEVGS